MNTVHNSAWATIEGAVTGLTSTGAVWLVYATMFLVIAWCAANTSVTVVADV